MTEISLQPLALTEIHSVLSRRRFIAGLSLAGVSTAVGQSQAGSTLMPMQRSSNTPKVHVLNTAPAIIHQSATIDLKALPSEWVQSQGRAIHEYANYLASLKLQHVTPTQIIEAHAKCRDGIWNILPPKIWWNRMGYTMRVVDRISKELNLKVELVVSCYRHPAYNAKCEGAKPGSWHQANVATDVTYSCSAGEVTNCSLNLRNRGLFKGGIGHYPSFTHIDTRGMNAEW